MKVLPGFLQRFLISDKENKLFIFRTLLLPCFYHRGFVYSWSASTYRAYIHLSIHCLCLIILKWLLWVLLLVSRSKWLKFRVQTGHVVNRSQNPKDPPPSKVYPEWLIWVSLHKTTIFHIIPYLLHIILKDYIFHGYIVKELVWIFIKGSLYWVRFARCACVEPFFSPTCKIVCSNSYWEAFLY